MLDDVSKIAEIDKDDALSIADSELDQFNREYKLDFSPTTDIQNVVVSGMGGSALAPDLLKSWPGVNVPFEVVRTYTLPSYVNENTLFVASSFSGNTEETLAVLEQAENAGAQIICVAAGGKLKERAEEKGYPFLNLDPDTPQPRMAVFDSLNAMTTALEGVGVIASGSVDELKQAAEKVRETSKSWSKETPTEDNLAKSIAESIGDTNVVIYTGDVFRPVGYKWKISFNENAKRIAWLNNYPELNHNEVSGWLESTNKPYTLLYLSSELEHEQVKKRMELTIDLLDKQGKRPEMTGTTAVGNSLIEQMLWAILLGDYVSLYVSIAAGVDPTPVDFQEDFKVELSKV